MTQTKWEDCDLSSITISPTLESAKIEVRSNYNGNLLTIVKCTGILSIRLSSALAIDNDELPAFIGIMQVDKLEGHFASECLGSHSYGFIRFGSEYPIEPLAIWRIRIEGGLIEVEILARECELL